MRVFERAVAVGMAVVLAGGAAWADAWDDIADRLVATQIDQPGTSPQASSWGYSTSSIIIDVDYAAGMPAQGVLVFNQNRGGADKLTAAQKAGQYVGQILSPRPEGIFSSDIYLLGALYQAETDPGLKAFWLDVLTGNLDRYHDYPLADVISWYLANPESPNLAAYDIAYIAVGAQLGGHADAAGWRDALISAVDQLTGGTETFQTLGLACAVWGLAETGGMPPGTIPGGYFAGRPYADLPGELAALQEGGVERWFYSNFDGTGCAYTQDTAFAIRALRAVDPVWYAIAIQDAQAAIAADVLVNGDLDSSLDDEGPMVYEPGVMGEALAAMPLAPPPPCVGCFIRTDANDDNFIDIGDAITMLDNLFNGVPTDCWDAVDANDDGNRDIADPVYTLNYLFVSGPQPPAPFPGYGPDPTEPDGLPVCTRVEP